MATWIFIKKFAQASAIVLTINIFFLIAAVYSASVPNERIVTTIRQAFGSGELSDDDWRPRDSIRGLNQYSDCHIMQMIVNDRSLMHDALAPDIKNPEDQPWDKSCSVLRSIVNGDAEDFQSWGYTRYWHGYIPVVTAFLSYSSLGSARIWLQSLLYFTIILVGVSSLRAGKGARILPLCIAFTALVLWSVPYFGQLFSHAIGDAFLMIGLAGFFIKADHMTINRWLIPYSASYGAVVTYFEMFTGQLPTAAGFLFVAAYLIAITRGGTDDRVEGWAAGVFSVLAFGVGAALTIVAKQTLTLLLTDEPVLRNFTESFENYSALAADSGSNLPWGRLTGFVTLFEYSPELTWWNESLAVWVGLGVVSIWVGAVALTWTVNEGRQQRISALAAFAVGSSSVLVWSLIFPVHTTMHALFMTRMLIVPVALGLAAFLYQWSETYRYRTHIERS